MIEYSEPLERAEEHASTALSLMKRNGIPPTPMNFTVWYAHSTGRHPDLSHLLELKQSHGQPFTQEASHEIFAQFFGTARESETLRDTGNRLQSTLEQVFELIARVGHDTSAYQSKLNGVQHHLGGAASPSQLSEIVEAIAAETRRMMQKSQALESSLQDSAREVDALRDHLNAVRREALTDSLTGVANRKCFDTGFAKTIEEALCENEPLCLLLCDIDHFKQFNDTYGHRIGDEVLKIVARHLQQGIKGQDLVARYGGEEFVILLPNTGLKGAVMLANNLRERLAKQKLKHMKTGDALGRVTLSIGAAQFWPGEPPTQLIERADAALYRAKREGRNRVAIDAEVPVGIAS